MRSCRRQILEAKKKFTSEGSWSEKRKKTETVSKKKVIKTQEKYRKSDE